MKKPTKVTLAIGLTVVLAFVGIALVRAAGPATAGNDAATAQCEPGRIDGTAKADVTVFGHPDGLAVVVANTANNPMPSLGATARSLLTDFVAASPTSGKRPYLFSAATGAEKLDYRWTKLRENGTESGTAARVNANLRNFGEALATPPTTSGLSMFEALAVAADQLASDGSRSPVVVLVGSGLDDTGPMATTTGLLDSDPASIAVRVAKASPGVDLKGVTVLAQSLGYTHAPQTEPTAAQRSLITGLWKDVLTELGATVAIDPAPAPECSITTDKLVEPTELPGVKVACEGRAIDYELPASVLFDGDSADLRDGVAELLSEPIRILLDNPGTTVALVGHTASSKAYTRQGLIRLSTDRAKAVRGVLLDAGIDAGRVRARGVGDTEPKHKDLNPDGTQNGYAAGERRVDMRITGVTTCPEPATTR